jgi:glycosyltransferase involved in cell wall biosynthesis
MRIMIATDAWRPQINGVVRSYEHMLDYFGRHGIAADVLAPTMFRNYPCPTYPEIRLAAVWQRDVAAFVAARRPDHIHIATEGPIGFQTRAWCLSSGRRFTTSYHTRFPEYVSARFYFPLSWSYAYQRWFHNAGAGMMVATDSLTRDLEARGFRNILRWTRGVDINRFRPRDVRLFGSERPVLLYVGRVAIEKNIKAFLDADVPGRKVVVGDGPQLTELRARYKDVLFTGPRTGEALAEAYASADAFVFPSLTDTFGIVLLEAMASGLPVAAFPVTGPLDVVTEGVTGALDRDLGAAIRRALSLDRARCRNAALDLSWDRSATMFLENIERVQLSGRQPV